MKSLSRKITQFPSKPGIYFFKNSKGQIIYIGKSVNLKNRVKSYWQKTSGLGSLTQIMVSRVKDIAWQVLASEFEALIWEAKLISKYQPKYNIRSKDNTSFILIAVTADDYPRILATRDKTIKARYFGPFVSASEVRQVLKTIRHIFPYRTCKPSHNKKTCMYYHLGLCPGCCIGFPKQEYKKIINKIIKLLNGNIKGLLNLLKKEMKSESQKLNFEKAANLKQQIQALVNVTSHWRSYSLEDLSLNLYPDKQKQVLKEAQKILPKLKTLSRVEGYDISNLSGQQASGSMVVFENLLPKKDQYRKFKIKTIGQPDDPGMIKEVLDRRLKHKEWNYPQLMVIDGGKGQLSAVVASLREQNLLTKIYVLGLTKPARGWSASGGNETIIKPIIKENIIVDYREITLEQVEPFLQLLQQLRDESHRFAKKYHLWLRKKKVLQ